MTSIKRYLAGAIALAASAGVQAAITPGGADSANDGAGSELVLTIFDAAAQLSYTADLGLSFNDGMNLANGPVWSPDATFNNDFLGAGGSLANSVWNVHAIDNNPTGDLVDVATHGRRFLGTATGGAGAMANNKLQSIGNWFDGAFSPALNNLPGHAAANGSSVIDGTVDPGNAGYWANNSLEAITPFVDSTGVDQSMNLWSITQSGELVDFFGLFNVYESDGPALSMDPMLLGSLHLDGNGTLSFTAIPIPGAVWLFGSALAAVAGIRRRTA